MKDFKENMIFFIGAGGIGMSALARYFNSIGKCVAGYDLTASGLTDKLISEGITISFADEISSIPEKFRNDEAFESCLVIYTPAIPGSNNIFNYFTSKGYKIRKRAEVLGDLVNESRGIAIAGTHGKTSVSVLTAHILRQKEHGCNAFLGGVSLNYNTNMLLSEGSDLMVVEADEFDRSFLRLTPYIGVITSIDPDHLDIYGNIDELRAAFGIFSNQIIDGGILLFNHKIKSIMIMPENVNILSYGLSRDADYFATNIRLGDGGMPLFDLVTPSGILNNIQLGVPGKFNVENAVAAAAVALNCGADEQEIRKGMESFKGIRRRFEIKINRTDTVLIDDYAHHPEELRAAISSTRDMFPGRHITAIFQPHLFTRTRDFAVDFAHTLSEADRLVLLDIYPAREEPLEGVSSDLIFKKVRLKDKVLCPRNQVIELMKEIDFDIVLVMGAGNIDALVDPLSEFMMNKNRSYS